MYKTYDYDKAIIDTCVLLDALMIHYIGLTDNRNTIDKWNKIIFKDNIEYKKNYTQFLKNIKKFVTTTHVIGELQGLANSRLGIKDQLKSSFWESSFSYMSYKNMDEKFIKLLDISQNNIFNNCIYDIGYVDTGLIELAQKENLTIITRDGKTLVQRSKQFACLTFNPEDHLTSKIS